MDPGPVTAPELTWSVEKRSPATREAPCELRIVLENTGQSRDLTVAGPLPFPPTPGAKIDGEGGGVGPALVPVDGEHDRRFDGTCWQAPLDDPDVPDDAPWDWGHGRTRTRTLGAGDRLEGRYHVVADWTSHCFGRGAYRFDRRYELAGTAYEWAFTPEVPSYDRY